MNETPETFTSPLPAYVITADCVSGIMFTNARTGRVRRIMQKALARFDLQVEYHHIKVQREPSWDKAQTADGQAPELGQLYAPEELVLPAAEEGS